MADPLGLHGFDDCTSSSAPLPKDFFCQGDVTRPVLTNSFPASLPVKPPPGLEHVVKGSSSSATANPLPGPQATRQLVGMLKSARTHYRALWTKTKSQQKYQGLPQDTPPPAGWETLLNDGKQWDFWEWWAGCAKLTKAVGTTPSWDRAKLCTGPPVSYTYG